MKEEFLRTRMEEKRISQADLSRKTDIPPGTISGVLRGEDGIEKTSYSNVRKICDVLDVNMDDLERIGPDGKLPEPVVLEEPVMEGPAPADVPPAGQEGAAEAPVTGTVPADSPERDGNEGEKDAEPTVADPCKGDFPVTGFDPEGFTGYDPEEEGLLEIKQYAVVSRLAACSEDDMGERVSVIPSVHTIEENGVYAVRLPGSRMKVLRRIWRMEDGLLLVGADRFDETPRIIRPETPGFAIIGKVVVEE